MVGRPGTSTILKSRKIDSAASASSGNNGSKVTSDCRLTILSFQSRQAVDQDGTTFIEWSQAEILAVGAAHICQRPHCAPKLPPPLSCRGSLAPGRPEPLPSAPCRPPGRAVTSPPKPSRPPSRPESRSNPAPQPRG